MQPGLPLFSTCTKFFMLFHHASFPSSPALNAGGDRKRGRKGRLVEEWRNIISMRSRRGFVLCRLPSAPSTFPPLALPSGPGRLWAVSRYTCSELPVCESVTGSVFTSTVCFRGCCCSDSAFWGVFFRFFFFNAHASSAPLLPSPRCLLCRGHCHRCMNLFTGWACERLIVILSDLPHRNKGGPSHALQPGVY